MAGLVFLSDGFKRGSVGYDLMTISVALIVLLSTATFLSFVVFEVFRSIRFAQLHRESRDAEVSTRAQGVGAGPPGACTLSLSASASWKSHHAMPDLLPAPVPALCRAIQPNRFRCAPLQSTQVTHVEAAIKQAQRDAREARRSVSHHDSTADAHRDPGGSYATAASWGAPASDEAGRESGEGGPGPPAVVEGAVKPWSVKRKTPHHASSHVSPNGTSELSLAAATTLVNSLSRAPSLSSTHGTSGMAAGGGGGSGVAVGGGRKLPRMGRTAVDRVLARRTPI
jgi:hypothetical protein